MIPAGRIAEGVRVRSCGLEDIPDDCEGTVVRDRYIGFYVWFGTRMQPLDPLRENGAYYRIRLAD